MIAIPKESSFNKNCYLSKSKNFKFLKITISLFVLSFTRRTK